MMKNLSGFNAKPIVHGDSQSLLAAYVAFRSLHRDVAQKKLDLLELAA
jgi:hypothetical protein